MRRARAQRPIEYRDRQSRVWYVPEVAHLKVVSASIDGPNLCFVIRFEREGEERFARWIGGDDWRERGALHRLFAEAEPVGSEAPDKALSPEAVAGPPLAIPEAPNDEQDSGVGPAPPETVALWVKLVTTMGPDELAERTFRQWERASLVEVRRAIARRRRELAG